MAHKNKIIHFIISFIFFNCSQSLLSAEKGYNWLKVDIGIIGSASVNILESALKHVSDKNYAGLIIVLDTPGGQLESTRKMVKSIIAADFPIVVWIGPGGAHAGSAGAFITVAANIAAMAPATNIGAAHPIQATGQNIGSNESKSESKLEEKVLNDTVSFMESIAELRNRNVEMARSFVTTSISITATEALEHKIIDFIAPDLRTLMQNIHGLKVELKNSPDSLKPQNIREVVLNTQSANIESFVPSFAQEILKILSNPNVFYLLFMAGIIGLGFELTHPGSIFPGVIGSICLLLALMATSVLPISFGAASLIFVGIALLVAEAFVPSFGVLGIGGFVAFVLGSIFLVDPNDQHGLRISLWTIAPSAVLIAASSIGIALLLLRSGTAKAQSGVESLIGKKAKIFRPFNGHEGRVLIEGEIWKARSELDLSGAKVSDEVLIDRIEGLTLVVKPT
ncbi:MAG: nodulation protein NfeD [Oligoflexales bacterium]|nr:nodulation protein NfeD [Oligoflexales bacterium]